jgi:pimeloyl-ACP methyl ester carboxylesterase
MGTATVDGRAVGYEIIGEGRPWVITPGGRVSRQSAGIRELAEALAERGNKVLIWDRPNTGESDVCFEGSTESTMQADTLAGLLRELDMAPAVIVGGSGGARVSFLTAVRHRDVAAAVGMWWISGGVFGLMSIANYYCGDSIRAAWMSGMEAVAALPVWQEPIELNPGNRDRILGQDRTQFIETLERWMAAYAPDPDEVVPGLTEPEAKAFDLPALVMRNGAHDLHHRRETSERIAAVLPNARLVEPPWGDDEWHERQAARTSGESPGLFVNWPLLAPMLDDWAKDVLG